MSFALKELTGLLTPETTLLGVVIAVDGVMIQVATPRGAMATRTLDALQIGDRVLVRNGMASRAPVATQSYPV